MQSKLINDPSYKFKVTNYDGKILNFTLDGNCLVSEIFEKIKSEDKDNQLKNIRYLCEGNNIENDYFKKIEEVKYFKNHLMLKVKWINNIVFIQSDIDIDIDKIKISDTFKFNIENKNNHEIISKIEFNYDDDSEIKLDKSITSKEDTNEFRNLSSYVNLSLKLSPLDLDKIVNGKVTVQMLLSLDVEKFKSHFRPSIDILFLIDNSSSMTGEKLELIKNSFSVILNFLDENDRISIFTFNDNTKRIIPLLNITKNNKLIISDAINKITTDAGTNILQAIEHAVHQLDKKKEINNITSIFLLSDGNDNFNQRERGENIIVKFLRNHKLPGKEVYSFNSFGFGNDHDPYLLSDLANCKNGSFYYIDKIEKLGQCFFDCLGTLSNVVANNAEIFLRLKENVKVKKIYGYEGIWKFSTFDDCFKSNITQLYSGKKLNYLFDVEIDNLKNFDNDIIIGEAICKITVLKEFGYKYIEKKTEGVLKLIGLETKVISVGEDSELIFINHLRFKFTEILSETINLLNEERFEEANELVLKFQESLFNLEFNNDENKKLFEVIKKNVMNAFNSIKDPWTFYKIGKIYLLEMLNALSGQKSNLNALTQEPNYFKDILLKDINYNNIKIKK